MSESTLITVPKNHMKKHMNMERRYLVHIPLKPIQTTKPFENQQSWGGMKPNENIPALTSNQWCSQTLISRLEQTRERKTSMKTKMKVKCNQWRNYWTSLKGGQSIEEANGPTTSKMSTFSNIDIVRIENGTEYQVYKNSTTWEH